MKIEVNRSVTHGPARHPEGMDEVLRRLGLERKVDLVVGKELFRGFKASSGVSSTTECFRRI